jgi:oligopeptide/dipeptide ABC transporter ATP-binding protein
LLHVQDITVELQLSSGSRARPVDGVSLEVGPGEAVGLVGESGAGKTTLALAIAGLLPAPARIAAGSIVFGDVALHALGETALNKLRGASIALILQEPGLALNPVLAVGRQICEVLRAHRSWSWARCRDEAMRLLAEVGLDDPRGLFGAFPHELSGGQRQRVVLAQAIACRPRLLIADEATTALDAVTRAAIIGLLRRLKDDHDMALLMISHDLGALGAIADRLAVMYAGRIVEEGPWSRIRRDPLHPYTRALLSCLPGPARGRPANGDPKLSTVPGEPPDLDALGVGCAFEPRCPDRWEACRTRSPLPADLEEPRLVRCFKHGG